LLRATASRLYAAAEAVNERNIRELLHGRLCLTFCDLGCDDGEWTLDLSQGLGAHRVFGVELVADRARIARKRGIEVAVADLGAAFPFSDESFDIVHANQVIEHMSDIDHFLAETKRVLRVGGAAVISTENGSSWHNILAAIMGWQIFSLTNVSGVVSGVGNPLALYRGCPPGASTWRHKTIFNYRGLVEILQAHGLLVERTLGAGYYPLPAGIGRIDSRHAHFIAVRAVRIA